MLLDAIKYHEMRWHDSAATLIGRSRCAYGGYGGISTVEAKPRGLTT
jgi:hypothetical protein